MKKIWVNFWTDLSMFLVMLGMAGTGIITRWILPGGQGFRRAAGQATLWGWTRHDYKDLHFYLALVLLALLALHIYLHWNWIVCRFRDLGLLRRTKDECEN